MINYVIVEDNELHMKKTKDIIIKYMMNNNYDFNIITFKRINDDFKRLLEGDSNYIFILDYQLEDMTAIDVARIIREKDWNSPIIIFTVNESKAFSSFKERLQLLDFVSKYDNAEKNLFELFDICFKQLKLKKAFKYKIYGIEYNIDYDKILYIYRDTYERKIIIVTDNNEYKIYYSLRSVKEKLPNYFKYTHKACIVNMNRVDAISFKDKTVIFDNGKSTNLISKLHKKELIDNELS